MKRFYGAILGTTPTNSLWTGVWASFETGGARFALHAIPAEIAKNIEIASPPVPREEEPVKLVFEVNDVESERARLESLGVQILRRPWQRPGEACDAVDPEGNVFQICSSGAGACSEYLSHHESSCVPIRQTTRLVILNAREAGERTVPPTTRSMQSAGFARSARGSSMRSNPCTPGYTLGVD